MVTFIQFFLLCCHNRNTLAFSQTAQHNLNYKLLNTSYLDAAIDIVLHKTDSSSNGSNVHVTIDYAPDWLHLVDQSHLLRLRTLESRLSLRLDQSTDHFARCKTVSPSHLPLLSAYRLHCSFQVLRPTILSLSSGLTMISLSRKWWRWRCRMIQFRRP